MHWDSGNLARRYFANLAEGRDLFDGYEDCTVFSDMVFLSSEELLEPYKDFERLAARYPDALFILNTRDCDKWIRSRHKHPNWTARYRSCFGLPSDERVEWHWREEWHGHHLKVLQFFSAQPERLLVFNIEQDGAEKLCRFFEPVFGRLNPSHLKKVN